MARKLRLKRGNTAANNAYTGAAGEITIDTDKDTIVVHDGVTAGGVPLAKESALSAAATQCIAIACSDETTALTAGTAKVKFRMPYAFSLTGVKASLSAAQTGGSIFTVDINADGVSILSTKLTVDNTELTSATASTAVVISTTTLADDVEISIDIDQIGNGTAKGLKVYLIGVAV